MAGVPVAWQWSKTCLLRNRQGVRFGILFPARLRISHDGKEKEFTVAEEAMRYVKKNIIPTETRK